MPKSKEVVNSMPKSVVVTLIFALVYTLLSLPVVVAIGHCDVVWLQIVSIVEWLIVGFVLFFLIPILTSGREK